MVGAGFDRGIQHVYVFINLLKKYTLLLHESKLLHLIKYAYANSAVFFVVFFIAQASEGAREEFLFGSGIEVTQSKDIRINFLDVFLDEKTSIGPVSYLVT